MKKIMILMIISLLLCGCGENKNLKSTNKTMSCSGMRKLLDEDDKAMLIDVRTKEEYAEGHLEGAVNIEYRELIDKLKDVDKNTNIIVYCKTGNRSDLSYNELKNSGFVNVYDLGSIKNCQET
ncbi:MAG TPA: rhodanese-like domain-containing protein [Firmicutes bacterium]|nr:rhodanese-like domain-containing protein [Bacillota bacterium]